MTKMLEPMLSEFREEAKITRRVYLRMLEVPVPVIYGRSADENPFAA